MSGVNKLRVLQVVPALGNGGTERVVFNYCMKIIPDIEFDFAVRSLPENGVLERPLLEAGCNVFYIGTIKDDSKGCIRKLEEIICNGNYDIVHDHSDCRAFFSMRIAKKNGVRVRIAHSHFAFVNENLRNRIVRAVFTPLTKLYATDLFACGKDAAVWGWGARAASVGRVHILNNAVDLECFSYSVEKRLEKRKELGIGQELVICNIGRVCYQKNHELLINIFQRIREKETDAKLLLVGTGELIEEVRAQVNRLSLSKSVFFLGARKDIPDLLSASDVFVLTSRYEGLPVVLVEAQANGIPCVVSDTVTREIGVTNIIQYVPAEGDLSMWEEVIWQCRNMRDAQQAEKVRLSGYDLTTESIRLKEYYFCLVERYN